MSVYLSATGIILVLIGAWFVAFEVVAKFKGDTHGSITPLGGIGTVSKLGAFIAWERRRNISMWIGLGCITVGSLLQVAGIFASHCR